MQEGRRDLVLDARPDFVTIKDRLGHPPPFGPCAGEEPRVARPREPTLWRMGLTLGRDIGRPVVAVDRFQCGLNSIGWIQIAESHLISPRLPEELIGQAAVAVLEFWRVAGRNPLHEILAVPKILDRPA